MINTELIRAQIETSEDWRGWCKKIPELHFDNDWNVRIIPLFAGALTRFVISKNNKNVSVYFDGYSKLGFMYDENDNPIPYFEIYSSTDSDVRRYYLNETEKMMNDIREVLNS